MTITQQQIDDLQQGQRAVIVSDTDDFLPTVGTVQWKNPDWIVLRCDEYTVRPITKHGKPFDGESLFVEPPKPPSIYANVEREAPVRGDVVHASGDEECGEVTVINRGSNDWMILQTGMNFWGQPPGTLTLLVDGTTGKAVD